ncbi:hypothetical protein [Bradyrhizobium sp. USDA 4454]
MSIRPEAQWRLKEGYFASIVPVGMSDGAVRRNEQAFPVRSRFFHLPSAKWLPHVMSARHDMT